jgi:hypothetical protein
MKKDNKDWKFWGLLVVGLTISLCGIYTPPIGIISDSLLIVIGNLTILVGALYDISIVVDIKEKYFCVGKNPKLPKETDDEKNKSLEQ